MEETIIGEKEGPQDKYMPEVQHLSENGLGICNLCKYDQFTSKNQQQRTHEENAPSTCARGDCLYVEQAIQIEWTKGIISIARTHPTLMDVVKLWKLFWGRTSL